MASAPLHARGRRPWPAPPAPQSPGSRVTAAMHLVISVLHDRPFEVDALSNGMIDAAAADRDREVLPREGDVDAGHREDYVCFVVVGRIHRVSVVGAAEISGRRAGKPP